MNRYDIEDADITHARLTGYARADYTPPVAAPWKAKAITDKEAFPYVIDEREDD